MAWYVHRKLSSRPEAALRESISQVYEEGVLGLFCSLRRPAVPNRKMGVLSHCFLGTTASAQSSNGPRALLYNPALRNITVDFHTSLPNLQGRRFWRRQCPSTLIKGSRTALRWVCQKTLLESGVQFCCCLMMMHAHVATG